MRRLLPLLLLLASPVLGQNGNIQVLQNSGGFLRTFPVGTTVTFCAKGAPGLPCSPALFTFTPDVNGNVNYTNVTPGDYQITITGISIASPESWVQSIPFGLGATVTLTGAITIAPPGSLTVSGTGTFTGQPNLFTTLDLGTVAGSPRFSKSVASCCTGFAEINTGLHLLSTESIDGGSLNLGTGTQSIPSGITFQDGGFNIVVQPAPRGKEAFPITAVSITSNVLTVTASQLTAFTNGDIVFLSGLQESFLNGQIVTVASSNGTTQFTANFTHANFSNSSESQGLAETGFIKASSTANLPDLADGTSTPNSGFILGVSGTDYTVGAGNCGFFSGGLSGVLHNSGFGCNTNILFPVNTRQVAWTNGSFQGGLTSAAVSANRVWTLPDAGGNVVIDTATQTLTNKSTAAGPLTGTVASGTATMTTAAITAGNCGTTVTVSATGVATTDTITWAFNAAPAGSNAGLVAWPTANNVNFAYCPNSAETPAAATINWRVVR